MRRSLISRRLIGRWTRVARTAISLAATTSGCATWLGYVPEQVRPGDNITQPPSYAEVKEWAYDVIDGYDTRATINRQSLYAGALLAKRGTSDCYGRE